MEVQKGRQMISLTKSQLTSLMISMILIRLYLSLPREMLVCAGNSAWILIIYLTILGLLLFLAVSYSYRQNESILDIAENVGGRVFKIITGIFATALILVKTSGHIKLFIESIQIVLLQNSETELIVICLGIALIVGAYAGIESLSIISGLFLPIVITVLLGFSIFLIRDMDINNLTPLLGTGAKSIFIDGLRLLYVFGDLFLLNFLLPYCKEDDVLKKSGIKAIIFNGLIFLVFMIVYSGIFPYPVSSEYIIPIFQLTRIVEIGDFFGRLEAFFEFVWAISFFIYGAVNIWVLSNIWKITFDLKYREPIIIPMCVFALGIGFLEPNIHKMINGSVVFSWIIIASAFFVPIIYGVLAVIKEKIDNL